FAEEVRRELARLYGEDALYQGGLSARTTLDPRLQAIADRALRRGLITYDRRHGWRGPVTSLDLTSGAWHELLTALGPVPGAEPWRTAVVLELSGIAATIGLNDGTQGTIPMAELAWARPWLEDQKVGAAPKQPSDLLRVGDVVLVEAVTKNSEGKAYPEGSFGLRQIPQVDGGLVALDPHTGRVLAMSGGFSFERSQFNRVTQATRQPGSAFKPFVYLAALDSGFTPATMVLDAPFVVDQGVGLGKWKPENYSNQFYGPTPMRIGVEKSRNLMTVRLAQRIGMEKVVDYARRFGVIDNMPPLLSMALGSAETTLLRLTTAYAMLVNGGKRIEPTVIDRVQDRHGRTVYRHDLRPCPGCRVEAWYGQPVPDVPDDREQLADPRTAYQVVSMLQGVVERGTGRRISEIGKPLAGKTGTTNDYFDAWFVGFTPDLAVGVFIGFDEPRTLGPKEAGSAVSAPVFKDFMQAALADEPAIPFRIPPGLSLVRVDPETGLPARPGDRKAILEAFLPGTVPSGEQAVIDGGSGGQPGDGVSPAVSGGARPGAPSRDSVLDSGLY
ncbi:MAG: penicillin-binding protein 1A, partial [Kiloniellales bacterium]